MHLRVARPQRGRIFVENTIVHKTILDPGGVTRKRFNPQSIQTNIFHYIQFHVYSKTIDTPL